MNSYSMGNVLSHPPSISSDGRKIALHGGFVMGSSKTGVYIYDTREDTTTLIQSFGSRPGTTGDENLTTGSHPSISGDGNWLTYYLREVNFPEGYGDPSSYEEGRTYCPCVAADEIVSLNIESEEGVNIIESNLEDECDWRFTQGMSLDIDSHGTQIAFISRANITGNNDDYSHEIFLAYERPADKRGPIRDTRRPMQRPGTLRLIKPGLPFFKARLKKSGRKIKFRRKDWIRELIPKKLAS